MLSEHVTGRQIVIALKGHWHGNRGSCRCPAHDDRDPSLSVTQRPDRVLVHCFAGCPQTDVIAALRSQGLWPDRDESGIRQQPKPPAIPRGLDADEISNMQAAREIWSRAVPIERTAASLYLWSRSLDTTRLPPTLRAASALYNAEVKKPYPALVAAIQDGSGRVTAVQRTWVLHRVEINRTMPAKGSRAPLKTAKKTLGPIGDGAIRLAKPDITLGIAEGLETGLSARQIFRLPIWVSCGAWRMGKLALPNIVARVVIFGDNGSEGEKAAWRAAHEYEAQGYTVGVELPPAEFEDWNEFQAARPGRLL